MSNLGTIVFESYLNERTYEQTKPHLEVGSPLKQDDGRDVQKK